VKKEISLGFRFFCGDSSLEKEFHTTPANASMGDSHGSGKRNEGGAKSLLIVKK